MMKIIKIMKMNLKMITMKKGKRMQMDLVKWISSKNLRIMLVMTNLILKL